MPEGTQPIVHDFTPSPIEQPTLNNQRSCLRRLIIGLISLIFLLIVAFTLIGLFFSKPTIQRLAQLPNHFPTDIPLSNFSDRTYINYLDAEDNNSLLRRLSWVPRFVLGTTVLKLNPDLTEEEKLLNNNLRLGDQVTWPNLQKLLTKPDQETHIDKIEIGWETLENQSPKKIYDFYKKNFAEQDYKVTPGANTDSQKGFYFTKNKVTGELMINIENKQTITKIILKVNFPSQEK